MSFKCSILALAVGLVVAGSASAATYSYTEGNGQNRALIAGSVDLEDASGSTGFILDDIGGGESLGIYGRIVGSVDRFTFTSHSAFDVRFDFDGYDLQAGGSVAAGLSGLVNQNYATSGGQNGTGGGKGVVISILDDLANVLGTKSFTTNVTSDTLLDPVIFGGLGPGTYSLVIDGRDVRSNSHSALGRNTPPIPPTLIQLPMRAYPLHPTIGKQVGQNRNRNKQT